jgi:hypothetical protein
VSETNYVSVPSSALGSVMSFSRQCNDCNVTAKKLFHIMTLLSASHVLYQVLHVVFSVRLVQSEMFSSGMITDQIAVFWVVTPRNDVVGYQRFRGPRRLHFRVKTT